MSPATMNRNDGDGLCGALPHPYPYPKNNSTQGPGIRQTGSMLRKPLTIWILSLIVALAGGIYIGHGLAKRDMPLCYGKRIGKTTSCYFSNSTVCSGGGIVGSGPQGSQSEQLAVLANTNQLCKDHPPAWHSQPED